MLHRLVAVLLALQHALLLCAALQVVKRLPDLNCFMQSFSARPLSNHAQVLTSRWLLHFQP